MKFPGALVISAVGSGLLCLGTPAALATTTVPDFPSWWKVSGDPLDGVTRTQFHAFHSDPNTLPSPDWVYDGFQPGTQDNWTTTIVTQFDFDGPGASPFFDSQGTRHGDAIAKGALISTDGGQMTKLMGNLDQPDWIKLFHVEIIWWGGDSDDDVSIDVQATGIVDITQTTVIIDGDDPNWHWTSIDGTINPQPEQETFLFNFAAVTQQIYVDSVYVGTHCVIPEPAALSLLALGGLAVMRRRRR
jgi:hypothetical protein